MTPIELAQTRRLLLAKQLLTETSMSAADVAFASGFSSVRRFNALFRKRYRLSPTGLRHTRATTAGDAAVLRLGYRPPFAWNALATFLAARATPCTEQFVDGTYRRTIRIGSHLGWIAARADEARAELRIDVAPRLLPAWPALRARLRHLFDLDASPRRIAEHLDHDGHLGRAIVPAEGLRIPGAVDGFDLALRTILGQQISVAAASTLHGRFVQAFGQSIVTPFDGLTHLPPTAEAVAAAPLQCVRACGVPRRRAETILAVARLVADGRLALSPGADPALARARLAAVPGIGPWSVEYIAMRALGDPDAIPTGDLALRRALGVQRAKRSRRNLAGMAPVARLRGHATVVRSSIRRLMTCPPMYPI